MHIPVHCTHCFLGHKCGVSPSMQVCSVALYKHHITSTPLLDVAASWFNMYLHSCVRKQCASCCIGVNCAVKFAIGSQSVRRSSALNSLLAHAISTLLCSPLPKAVVAVVTKMTFQPGSVLCAFNEYHMTHA